MIWARSCFLLTIAALCTLSFADDHGKKQSDRTIVARVNGQPIYASEVRYELNQALKGKQLDPQMLSLAQAKMLEQLVDRQLVVTYLARTGQAASEQDVEFALEQLVKKLKAREVPLADHLKSLGIAEDELRRELAWKLSWQKYLEKYLTSENLEKYFEKHRRQFDGTQLRVAHILLKADATDAAAVEAAKKQAAEIRQQIEAGELTFAAAAGKFSQGPSAPKGGDIGLIERQQPMPEPFSQAAFALEQGGISQPIVTAFGVHLIRCLEIKPGQKRWQEVAPELEAAVTKYLFHWIADRERATAKVEFQPN